MGLFSNLGLQDFDLSERRTPRSLTSCSKMIGTKDPTMSDEIVISFSQARQIRLTDATDDEHLGRPTIAVPP